MRSLFLLTCAMFLLVATSQAQLKALTKANNAVNKANDGVNKAKNTTTQATTSASNAVATVDSTTAEVKGVANALGIKKKPLNTTVIKVPGATLGKLKKILAGLKECPGVDGSTTTMVCDDNDQSITVMHKGSTSDLISALVKKTTLVTTDNAQVSEGSVTVKL